jgi:hypothetical protein
MKPSAAALCPRYEHVMGPRQVGIDADASCVSEVSRVESFQSVAVCALHDWELLDDPILDYYHLVTSPGRRQGREFNCALLTISFTMPPMFVLLRALRLHVMKR